MSDVESSARKARAKTLAAGLDHERADKAATEAREHSRRAKTKFKQAKKAFKKAEKVARKAKKAAAEARRVFKKASHRADLADTATDKNTRARVKPAVKPPTLVKPRPVAKPSTIAKSSKGPAALPPSTKRKRGARKADGRADAGDSEPETFDLGTDDLLHR